MPSVYLAGAISGLTHEEATTWRNNFAALLPSRWSVLDPMKGVTEFIGGGEIGLVYPDQPLLTDAVITDTDLWHIRNCDVVVVNFTNAPPQSKMIGTMFEIGYARALNKLVYAVARKGSPYFVHPFITRQCIIFEWMSDVHRAMERL